MTGNCDENIENSSYCLIYNTCFKKLIQFSFSSYPGCRQNWLFLMKPFPGAIKTGYFFLGFHVLIINFYEPVNYILYVYISASTFPAVCQILLGNPESKYTLPCLGIWRQSISICIMNEGTNCPVGGKKINTVKLTITRQHRKQILCVWYCLYNTYALKRHIFIRSEVV